MLENSTLPMTRVLYRQRQLPVLQNRVYSSKKAACNCPKGDIEIAQDSDTGLIFNVAFQPELMVYDTDYNNEQGMSVVFQRHLDEVANRIIAQMGKTELVEVGCGKGGFLELLLKRGIDVTGFDSTYDGDNPRIVKRYFETGIITTPRRGLILRHVLEHIPNPIDFLFRLQQANGGQGFIYIEVPCFDWIMRRRTWFDIFYEHVNYFRLTDFHRMFGSVIESGRCFGDQYLYVIADLATLREPQLDESDLVDFPTDFLSGLSVDEQNRTKQNKTEQNRTKQNKTEQNVCVWGGASKGVIFSLLRERIGMPVDMVIDVNPAKQGMYLPGTGIQVQSPAEALQTLAAGSPLYVMNTNYLEEIKAMSNHLYNYIGIDQ